MTRYARDKYEDKKITTEETRVYLDGLWRTAEKAKREGGKPAKLTMAILMRSRSTLLMGKASGYDRVTAELVRELQWNVIKLLRHAFDIKYMRK